MAESAISTPKQPMLVSICLKIGPRSRTVTSAKTSLNPASLLTGGTICCTPSARFDHLTLED
jgi:hypothetical protein